MNGLVTQPFTAFASVVAVALLELTEEARHAQRAKRGGERLVSGGAQFSGIERFSLYRSGRPMRQAKRPRYFLKMSGDRSFALTGNAVTVGAVTVLAVGLAKVRRAEAEKISQRAMKVFIFQRKEFFASSQATLRFHGRASVGSRVTTKS